MRLCESGAGNMPVAIHVCEFLYPQHRKLKGVKNARNQCEGEYLIK